MKDRVRISARQTSKGLWYFEATLEKDSDTIKITNNPDDLGDVEQVSIGKQLLKIIQDTEREFRIEGKKCV